MWKKEDGGSGILKKAKRVGEVSEEGGVEAKPGRKEWWQCKVSLWSSNWFPRSKPNGISPRGKGGKSSSCKKVFCVQVWQGALPLA